MREKRFRRRAARVFATIFALIVVAMVGTIVAFPVAAAIACPTCYGLEPLSSNVFVERTLAPEARAHVIGAVTEARKRVRDVYGQFESDPRVLVCSSETCYRHIGGGHTRGKSFFDLALILSPRGVDQVIAAHELSHIELHHRVGFVRFLSGTIPAWFDRDSLCLCPMIHVISRLSEWRTGVSSDRTSFFQMGCSTGASARMKIAISTQPRHVA